MRRKFEWLAMSVVGACVAAPAGAQVRLDRADPTITEQALPRPVPAAPIAPATVTTLSPPVDAPAVTAVPRVATAIVVDGNHAVSAAAFADVLVPFLGHDLTATDLRRLAGAVAGAARQAGYPFATATIGAQEMRGGVLHVTLDEGRIAAVRIIGAKNALADRLLTRALVTDGPVRRSTLERAIMLVGDIPGLVVKDSRYVRQDGFGILLVTVTEDRAAAYGQVDNRGSAEVGPIRATMLASYRDAVQAGDELGLVVASTPVQPSEFAFVRGRYTAPVGADGGTLTVSGSFGRANPGGLLKPLDVIGHSVDAAVAYAHPLIRTRARSLVAGIELRALKSDLTLLGTTLRNDRLSTVTASLGGTTRVGPGTVRGELQLVGGLPLDGVTRQGDRRTSRADGDARFATVGYTVEWTAPLADRLSLALASSGQLASRPLLATAEIGVGGPGFGRAYDYAERTGDQGVLGSAEVRLDLGRVSPIVDRCQLYGIVGGGHVDNLRGGVGGGSLLSGGGGVRLGHGPLDGMIELAFPLNQDRIDTGNRRPRLSFRLSRSF